jgi:hypothetical protein
MMSQKFSVLHVAMPVELVLPTMSVSSVLKVETTLLQIVIVLLMIMLMVIMNVKIVTINVQLVTMKMKETFLVTLVPKTESLHQLAHVLKVFSMKIIKPSVHNVPKFVILVLEKPLTV